MRLWGWAVPGHLKGAEFAPISGLGALWGTGARVEREKSWWAAGTRRAVAHKGSPAASLRTRGRWDSSRRVSLPVPWVPEGRGSAGLACSCEQSYL